MGKVSTNAVPAIVVSRNRSDELAVVGPRWYWRSELERMQSYVGNSAELRALTPSDNFEDHPQWKEVKGRVWH